MTDKDVIYCEDCEKTMQRKSLKYHYAIFSPPDFSELGMKPKEGAAYYHNLSTKLHFLAPTNDAFTLIVSDRKADGIIYQKHLVFTRMFELEKDWRLISQKIWVRSRKVSLFRMPYTFMLTFARKKYTCYKLPNAFPDVVEWAPPEDQNGFPPEVVQPFLEMFTKEGDIVYDPFIGTGSTAIACMRMKRHFVGSEIVPEIYKKAADRINAEENK